MRLLTLAEALHDRGHEVILASAEIDVPWLSEAVAAAGVEVVSTVRDDIDVAQLAALGADWVVVDSYLVPADAISALDERVPVLLVADGDARGARASLYLDQNLGAPVLPGVAEGAQLRGAAYALVRRAVRDSAASDPVALRHAPPEVVVVLGGTDPDDRTIEVASACAGLADRAAFAFVAPERQHDALRAAGRGAAHWRVMAQTPDLPALLGGADVVVSAGGTSAWDVGTLAAPAVLLAVVPNQQASLAAVAAAGIALGFDLVDGRGDMGEVARAVERLLGDEDLRASLVAACRATFDGRGAERVVQVLEERARTRAPAPSP